jgi:hypothetical protein
LQRALAWIEPEYCNASAPIIKKQSLENVAHLRYLGYQSEVLRHASM